MRTQTTFAVLAAATAALVGFACSEPPTAITGCPADSPSGAVVTIAWRGSPDSLRVLVKSPQAIRAACSYVDSKAGPSIPVGRIARGAGVDARFPFHYLPESVSFTDVTMELCDSKLLRTTEEVDAYFVMSTGSAASETAPYCPWSARPVRVEPAT